MTVDGWSDICLEDVAELTVGHVGSMVNEYVTSGVPFLRSLNVEPFRININDLKYITPDFNLKLSKSQLRPGDLVIVRTGKPGACAVIPNWLQESNCSDLVIVRPHSRVDRQFLMYYINSIAIQHVAAHLVGAVQQHFNVGSAKKIPVHIPSLIEQRAIANILGTLDDKIELNRQMNSTLEQIAQALFKRWFIDFEFPDENGNPYRSSGGRMVDSELGEIPEGWGVGNMGEILELAYGKALKTDKRIPGSIPVYGSNGQVGWHNQKLVSGPGIIVGRKGNPGTVTWAHTDFYPIDTTFYVIPKGSVKSKYYLLHALQKQDLPSFAADSAVPGLNRNMVYMNRMIVPQRDILDLFDSHLNKIYQKIQVNEEQAQLLGSVRDSLLPKLMSGKIRIPIADNVSL